MPGPLTIQDLFDMMKEPPFKEQFDERVRAMVEAPEYVDQILQTIEFGVRRGEEPGVVVAVLTGVILGKFTK